MIEPRHIRQAVERTVTALAISTTKPGPKGSGGGAVSGGTVEPPSPIPDGVMWGKRLLHERLQSWAQMIGEDAGIVINCDNNDLAILGWLNSKAHIISEHAAALDFLEELTEATKMIEAPYQPRVTRTWIGKHGGGDVTVRENQPIVELEDGRVEHVESIRAWNRDQVRLAEGTAAEVAEMIWEFFNIYIKPNEITEARTNDDRIKSRHPGLLSSTRKDGREHIYTVQNVLDRFPEKETITRVDKQGPIV